MTREHEFYETPPGVTLALLQLPEVNLEEAETVLDPCSGEAAILKVLASQHSHLSLFSNDLDTGRPSLLHEDASHKRGWRNMRRIFRPTDWVITNPPFSLAHLILPHAIAYAKVGVALLLPLRWLEPTSEREPVLREHPPTAIQVLGSPRPSFTEDGNTDSVTTFWAVWLKQKEPMPLYMATSPGWRWNWPLLPAAS